jgi:hypothetical protein
MWGANKIKQTNNIILEKDRMSFCSMITFSYLNEFLNIVFCKLL